MNLNRIVVTRRQEKAASSASVAAEKSTPGLCLDAGPQTPRDISSKAGLNTVSFPVAPPANEMNLCNIHTHTNAEHRGPGFSVFVNATDQGGFACNGSGDLSDAELAPADGAFKGVSPGDTVEVHWVHTSCNATPGVGLGACVPESCTDPTLRVEAQVFLVVNDASALNFLDMSYDSNVVNGFHQAKMIPSNTGEPVQFLGSTTGPSYTMSGCSAAQVTWNVRTHCAKLDINSLHAWAEAGNVSMKQNRTAFANSSLPKNSFRRSSRQHQSPSAVNPSTVQVPPQRREQRALQWPFARLLAGIPVVHPQYDRSRLQR